MRVCGPGYAGQVSNNIEEVFLRHFTEAWELWEDDDGGAFFPSPSCNTKHHTAFTMIDSTSIWRCLTVSYTVFYIFNISLLQLVPTSIRYMFVRDVLSDNIFSLILIHLSWLSCQWDRGYSWTLSYIVTLSLSELRPRQYNEGTDADSTLSIDMHTSRFATPADSLTPGLQLWF